ncbi:distal membrane-arm assembly complex protein 1 isoform X1 [Phyllostomus hastatus]|uniref:distal membrane-arm assembly complex protein 1 isoform X1 n=1 Tax=Phyllostomus hastatus TaxID=9423 RepID=UPI001E681866|nr:distal membrane-arm assembly complex protein 1 isoform X1 [Phyllostomus hastatus]
MNMGSFMSQPLESDKVAAPPEAASSASPAPMDKPRTPTSAEQPPVFNNCWSCRVLSGHCLLGCGHPVRSQRKGLPSWLKILPVNLFSVPAPMTHRASMGLLDILDTQRAVDVLQFCRFYKTEKTNIGWHFLDMNICGHLLGLHKDQ